MFDAAVPTDTASSTDWNPSRFADTSPLAGNLPALVGQSAALVGESPAKVGQSAALVGESPTSEQQRCEVLSDEITTLAGHLNAANYRFLKLLDEFDRHDGWAGDGIRSLAHWLNFKCGLGEMVAREKVRAARALRSLPSIDDAFERGEISYSKVRAMTRVATPENEAELLNIARHGTAAHMERLVRAYRRCRKQVESAAGEAVPGGLTPDELARRREERFYCFADDDETMVFGGRVAVEQGRLLVKALDAMVAEIDADAAAAETANEPELAGNVSAETNDPKTGAKTDAETDAQTGPETDENVSAETSGDEPESAAVDPTPKRTGRATALIHIAEHYLATGGNGARPLTSSEAYQVFVHVNANDAGPDNRINGAHTCYADDRRCLAPHVVRQLACDASRRTVLENERGEVLNIGRRSRTVPRRIGHALRVRDGGCRFPGCGQSRWTDAHHIRHWADGGETSLENLVTLCRYHHRSLHREEYGIEHSKENGTLIFLDGRGNRMPSTVYPQFRSERSATESVQQLRTEHADRGVEIDATTAVTAWQGERMDYSTAIEWLLHRDGVAI